jgi:hypothetical protein
MLLVMAESLSLSLSHKKTTIQKLSLEFRTQKIYGLVVGGRYDLYKLTFDLTVFQAYESPIFLMRFPTNQLLLIDWLNLNAGYDCKKVQPPLLVQAY